jgi:hypothetical protein
VSPPGPYRRNESPSSAMDELYTDYEGTPYLTGLANLCAAIGTFVGAWTLIILLGTLHRGFAQYWSLVLILVVDITINIVVRVLRFRRRRALGLTRAQRRWRLGLGPRPAGHR